MAVLELGQVGGGGADGTREIPKREARALTHVAQPLAEDEGVNGFGNRVM